MEEVKILKQLQHVSQIIDCVLTFDIDFVSVLDFIPFNSLIIVINGLACC